MRLLAIGLFVAVALVPESVYAATLLISPSSGTYHVGDTISARVVVSSDVSVNAVSASLNFTSDTLGLTSISKSSSFLSFWVQEPTYSNSAGTASVEGVSPGVGYTGGAGRVITLTFRAKKEGTGSITFQAGSVLANDGNGTNVLGDLTGASYTITPALNKPTPAATKEIQPAPPETTEPPIIVHTVEYSGSTSIHVVHGLTKYPGAPVTLYFGPVGTETLRTGAYTDSDGSFVIRIPDVLKPTSYVVRATVTAQESESGPSNEVTMVIPHTLESIVWLLLPYVSVALLILVIIAACIFAFWYGSVRLLNIHRKLSKEAREAEGALKKSFTVLRQDLSGRLRELKHARHEGADEERSVLTGLKKDLDDAEAYIAKEIGDITSIRKEKE